MRRVAVKRNRPEGHDSLELPAAKRSRPIHTQQPIRRPRLLNRLVSFVKRVTSSVWGLFRSSPGHTDTEDVSLMSHELEDDTDPAQPDWPQSVPPSSLTPPTLTPSTATCGTTYSQSAIKEQGRPSHMHVMTSQRRPVMLREVENARDKLLYDQIMASHCSLPSPRPPPSPRMLSLSIPLLHRHPEVIGPSRSPSERSLHSPPLPSVSPPEIRPQYKYTSTAVDTGLSLSHINHRSNHFRTHPQYSSSSKANDWWGQRSYQSETTAAIWTQNKQIQTLQTSRRRPLPVQRYHEVEKMRRWMEEFKTDHKHSVADRRAVLEVAEKYLLLNREDRMKTEDARMARLRKQLDHIGLKETHIEEMELEFTPEQRHKVAMAIGRGPSNEVLSERYRIQIKRSDLATLSGLEWLNDEVINFYFSMIAERSREGERKVHMMTSFFYPKLLSAGYSGVRRWTKKVDLFAHDVVLLPIHLGCHWCLAVIDFRNKELQYYDSLCGNYPSCFTRLRSYLVDEAKDKKGETFDLSQWEDKALKNIPLQRNGSDCGVFACMYARFIARDLQFTFTQDDMPSIRKHMMCEILEQRLF